MKTSRRTFIQTIGAGAAGVGLASTVPSFAAETASTSKAAGSGRKMVVRADDVGFSKVCNIGTFETIEKGVVTSADVMLDSPGTEDALERLRALPWISVGWHMHMWGAPVLDPKQVPSLVEKEGPFAGRFRLDLSRAEDVVFDEALRELRAQLDRCIRILGRVPDTGSGGRGNSSWGRAVRQVNDEYGLPYGFAGQPPTSEEYVKKIKAAQEAGEEWAKYYSATPNPATIADEKWASRKIINAAGTTAYIDLLTDSVSQVEAKYDPVLFYTEDRAGILKYPEDVIITQSWHPGYVDYYVYRLGERGNRARAQQFVVGRVQDVAALCDIRLKDWIRENRIELVNFRDALYGTREYQNHLKLIGSDLALEDAAKV
jgi:predicted glycoside hydrolase/deacetylase ChbG (UPF0249 family)